MTKEQPGPGKEKHEGEKQLVFWHPEYDPYSAVSFRVNPGEEEKLTKALKHSYGLKSDGVNIDAAEREIQYLESLLNEKFHDDVSYRILDKEEAIFRTERDKFFKKGKPSPDELIEKINDVANVKDKTTRGFLQFRIGAFRSHVESAKTGKSRNASDLARTEDLRKEILGM